MEDLTLSELFFMKGDVEECYGKGIFEKHIYKDVVHFLGVSEDCLTDHERERSGKYDKPVTSLKEKRSFVDVLLHGSI